MSFLGSARSAIRRYWSMLLAAHGLLAALLALPEFARAQGVTTAGIRGSVHAESSGPLENALVHIGHQETGFAVEARTRRGRFLVQGLEPGGPYVVTVQRLGFVPQRRERVFLALGELVDLEVMLQPVAVELATVTVAASEAPHASANAHGGTGTMITEPMLHGLPTLNRDLYDFVRLVPQVSMKIGLPNPGFSAGGAGFRFNNFLINGVSERTLSGNVSSGFAGARSVPLDAVQEYQVLLAPYDVRYGDFSGALINTVTKAGTNTPRGSVFVFGRNDRLARGRAGAATGYRNVQYGLSLGGPVIRDRLHFFIAPDIQRFTFPAAGPYVGQPADAQRPVPVNEADLARFDEIMRTHGLSAGSAGPVENGHPLRNVYTRFDLALPAWHSRAVAWSNYSGSEDIAFTRAATDTFSLSSYQVNRVALSRMTAVQLHTSLPRAGGGHNELLVSHRSGRFNPGGAVQQPIVRVSVPASPGGRVTINSGTHEAAQAAWIRPSAVSVKDNLTLPLGAFHVLTLGAEAERFQIHRGGLPGSFGTWTFSSLDQLELGTPDRYEVAIDFGVSGVPLTGVQYAAYAGDQWQASERLSLTAGLRIDMLAINERPPYHPGVDSIFGRRTDEMPRRRAELSPRIGFIWDLTGTREHRLRGGAGIFAGRFPLAWAQTALSSHGIGGGLLRCGRSPADLGFAPAFNPDHRLAPSVCANGSGIVATQRGDVDLLDSNLRMMRTARGSIAYDVGLPGDVQFTAEALLSRMLSDFVFVNLNLADPVTTDRHGRVMYGTIGPAGVSTPNLRSGFSEVIDIRNTSRNRAYQFATRLERTFHSGSSGMLSYTYSRVRDVQTPLRAGTRGIVAWSSARVVSGRHDDFSAGISSNDIPHRVVAAGTYAIPWWRGRTVLSFYYVGESGRPFTYLASGTLRRGDLNADGAPGNDPIYVPRSAFDTSEIRFSGSAEGSGEDNSEAAQSERIRAQQSAFEAFVGRTSCLRRQRGRILDRNSCREPWSNTTIASVRQVIPAGRRTVEAQLDVFNVLNLLRSDWGHVRQAAPAILEHVGQTADAVGTSHSVFRFNPTAPAWATLPAESAFQLQLALRYRF